MTKRNFFIKTSKLEFYEFLKLKRHTLCEEKSIEEQYFTIPRQLYPTRPVIFDNKMMDIVK